MSREIPNDPSLSPLMVPGTVLAGKFQVVRKIGRGGMGVVVEAHHMELDERVALKFLQPTAANETIKLQRFYREARTAAKIKSEHVTRVLDVGKLDTGEPYMVMEFLEGIDLSKYLKTIGPLPIREAVDYILQAADAVAEAHANGIIHRDLKPANLFLADRPDGTRIVKVLDFGIAKQADEEISGLTERSLVFGSIVYMSPEQTKSTRDVDHRTDVYALGVTLYELITGRPPFYAKFVPEILAQKATGRPTPLREVMPDAPAELERVLDKAFERELSRRYDSVAAFARGLTPFASEASKPILARITRINENTTRSFSRAKIIPELKQFAKEIELELELEAQADPDAEPKEDVDWSDEWSDEYSLKKPKTGSQDLKPLVTAAAEARVHRSGNLLSIPGVTPGAGKPLLGMPPPLPPLAPGAARPPLASRPVKVEEASHEWLRTGDLRTADLRPEDLRTADLRPEDLQTADLQPEDLQPARREHEEYEPEQEPEPEPEQEPKPEPDNLGLEEPRQEEPHALYQAMPQPEEPRADFNQRAAPKGGRGGKIALGVLALVTVASGAAFSVLRARSGGVGALPEAVVDAGSDALVGETAPTAPSAVTPTAVVSASAAPTAAPAETSAPAAASPTEPMLRHLCPAGSKASAECTLGLAAWCDTSDQRIACCEVGLVATGKGGQCGCPEGGPLMPKALAMGCKLPPDSKWITPALLHETMQEKQAAFQDCYASVPPDPKRYAAQVMLGLELSPDGRVYAVRVSHSTVPDPKAEACVLDVARRLKFPPPPAKGMRFNQPLTIPLAK